MRPTLLVSALVLLGCCVNASEYTGEYDCGLEDKDIGPGKEGSVKDAKCESEEAQVNTQDTGSKFREFLRKQKVAKDRISRAKDRMSRAKDSVKAALRKYDAEKSLKNNNALDRANDKLNKASIALHSAEEVVWENEITWRLAKIHSENLKLKKVESKVEAAKLKRDEADSKVSAAKAKVDNNRSPKAIEALNLAKYELMAANIELGTAELHVSEAKFEIVSTNDQISIAYEQKARAKVEAARDELEKAKVNADIAQEEMDKAEAVQDRLCSNDGPESIDALKETTLLVEKAEIVLRSAKDECNRARIARESTTNVSNEAKMTLKLADANVRGIMLKMFEAKLGDAECRKKDAKDKVDAAQIKPTNEDSPYGIEALEETEAELVEADIALSPVKANFGKMTFRVAEIKTDIAQVKMKMAFDSVVVAKNKFDDSHNFEDLKTLKLAMDKWSDVEKELDVAMRDQTIAEHSYMIALLQVQRKPQKHDKSDTFESSSPSEVTIDGSKEVLVGHQKGAADSLFGRMLLTTIHQKNENVKQQLENDDVQSWIKKQFDSNRLHLVNKLDDATKMITILSVQAQLLAKNMQEKANKAKEKAERIKQRHDKIRQQADENIEEQRSKDVIAKDKDDFELTTLISRAERETERAQKADYKLRKKTEMAKILAEEAIETQQWAEEILKRFEEAEQQMRSIFVSEKEDASKERRDKKKLRGLVKEAQKLVAVADDADLEISNEKTKDQLDEVVRRINAEMDRRDEGAAQREAIEDAKNARVGRSAKTQVDRAVKVQVEVAESVANRDEAMEELIDRAQERAIGKLIDKAQKQAIRAQERADRAILGLANMQEILAKVMEPANSVIKKVQEKIAEVWQQFEKLFQQLADLQPEDLAGRNWDKFMLVQLVNRAMRLGRRAQGYVEHAYIVGKLGAMRLMQADKATKKDARNKQEWTRADVMSVITEYMDREYLMTNSPVKRLIYDAVRRVEEKAKNKEAAPSH